MSLRIAEKYKACGGVIHTNAEVEKVILNGKKSSRDFAAGNVYAPGTKRIVREQTKISG